MTATSEQLAKLMSGVELLMLDFDGPICSVFAGLPAAEVAQRLRGTLRANGVAMSGELDSDNDPLSIYRHSSVYGPAITSRIYQELVDAEVQAVASAVLTPGATDVVRMAREGGRRVAVVSNNAAVAVEAFLAVHELANLVSYVAARRTPVPALMKPSPAYVTEALAALRVPPGRGALVGDSETDIEAARMARVRSVGYANKPGKASRLSKAGADVVTDTMGALAAALVVPASTD